MDAPSFPKIKMRRTLFIIAIMIVLNLIVFNFLPYSSSFTHIDGSTVTRSEFGEFKYSAVLIGIPMIGFSLGLLISIIPYKRLSYRQKYLPFSLITIAILHLFIFLRVIISTIF